MTSQLVKQHKNLFERLDIQDPQTLYTVAFVHSTQLEH